jgi:hypothetical protein
MDKAVRRLGEKNFPRATEKARGSTNAYSGTAPDLSGTTLGPLETSFLRRKVARSTDAGVPSSAGVGSVVPAGQMIEPRSGQTATLLSDGRVLIVGGLRRNQDFSKSAELYDPATGKFQLTGEMSIGRVGQVAVLLRSGKVLIAGGWIGGHSTTDSAELYDPATGKFTVIGKLTTRRARPSAKLLTDGNVLLAGGADHDGPDGAIASVEIFRADAVRFQPTGSLHRPRSGQTATLHQRWQGSHGRRRQWRAD